MRELFLAPDGNDSWSGTLTASNTDRTDGPLATLAGVRDRIRHLKTSAQLESPFTVHIRGGRYAVKQPVTFTPEDSGSITYAAYRNEKPVFDGSQPITNWRAQPLANGMTAWVADLPDVLAGRWYFRSLFVAGKRRPRTIYPKTGELEIIDVPEITRQAALFDGTTHFITRPEDVKDFCNLQDIDVLVPHFWVEERMPVQSWDKATGRLTSTRRSIFCLKVGFGDAWARYRLENVFEALETPGQWYLDRAAGKVYYLPLPGEKLNKTVIAAPRVRQFLILKGDPNTQQHVQYLTFRGICFTNTDWQQSRGMVPDHDVVAPGILMGADAQAAVGVEGAIDCDAVRHCAFENLTLRGIGEYAINMQRACMSNRIVGNHLHDLGGGGVKIYGANAAAPRHHRSGNNRITDNDIHDIGEVFKPAIGVIVCHSFGNVIAHNDIHHTHYSGVSVGWVWGYGESVARDNIIEKNHIHHIGKGVLSDMGGIYTLGVQPGTVIRGNLIHDVRTAEYGGWAIYPDEGSSHMIIENNLCYDTQSSVFHTHYGRELIVRNNIFAFGGQSIIALGRREAHNSFTMTHNIIVADHQPVHCGSYNATFGATFGKPSFIADYNVLWDVSNKTPVGAQDSAGRGGAQHTLASIQQTGIETHSKVVDPGFKNLAKRDFALPPNSPAIAMGFKPLDLSDVGPRSKTKQA